MIEVLSPAQLEKAKKTGAFVSSVLKRLQERVGVGTNLLEIDAWAAAMIAEAGAVSCYVDYAPAFGRGPFGHVICTSVNDAVLHGLPHDYTLADGDLLTLDFAVSLNGIVADSAVTFIVGTPRDPQDQRMIDVSRRALNAGIAAARPGARVGEISAAIGKVLKAAGYKVNLDFGGHGVGTTMHQEPHIANDGKSTQGYKLKPGLLLAIEPWIMADTAKLVMDPDGWTLRSATGARTAHMEHTVAITKNGAEVLTA